LQTLRGTIDWSYDLLDEEEKVLFSRLNIFQGGRTIATVEEICAPGLSIPILDGLESLLNKSLLYKEEGPRGEPRFLMLETIHEYAREKLSESGEKPEIEKRHAEYFTRLAGPVEMEVAGVDQGLWVEHLRSEHDNLRAALAFALRIDECKLALQIVGGLRDFWYYTGHIGEGLVWIGRALESADKDSTDLRAKAFNTAGWLSFIQGGFESGILIGREALALYEKPEDDVGTA
jgi:predicted ATPase